MELYGFFNVSMKWNYFPRPPLETASLSLRLRGTRLPRDTVNKLLFDIGQQPL